MPERSGDPSATPRFSAVIAARDEGPTIALVVAGTRAVLPAGSQILGGSTHYFQAWYRDLAAGGMGFNLSDAIRVTFCS